MPRKGADVKIVVGILPTNSYERAFMPQALNNIEEATHPKIDLAQYIRTENKPDEDSDTQNPVQPEQPEAE